MDDYFHCTHKYSDGTVCNIELYRHEGFSHPFENDVPEFCCSACNPLPSLR